MGHRNIFNDRINIGMNEYTFNIIVTSDESFYLIIAESEPLDGRHDNKRIRVPIENVNGLRDALNRVIVKIDEIDRKATVFPSPKSTKHQYLKSVEKLSSSSDPHYIEQRKLYPKAYMSWSIEDDERLEKLFCDGTSIEELSISFQRNPGAIRSRIKKLELLEKYR